MTTPPTIVVDDTDVSIKYSGPWGITQGSITGIYGPPYNSTNHVTNSNGEFTFPFNGTGITVYAVNNASSLSGLPTWSCSVDGIPLSNMNFIQGFYNRWPICSNGVDFSDQQHTLVVNITAAEQPFIFDFIQYIPSSNPDSRASAVIKVDHLDPMLSYSDGWKTFDSVIAQGTQSPNAKVTLTFIGKSATWVGYLPSNYPNHPSQAAYSIDGGSPIPFTVPTVPEGLVGNTLYNQIFFSTPDLQPGPHSMIVTHLGDSTQMPLTLEWIWVKNASIAELQSSLSSSSTIHSSQTTTINSSQTTNSVEPSQKNTSSSTAANSVKRKPILAIVGAIIGFIFLLTVLIFFYVRRRRTLKSRSGSELDPYLHDSLSRNRFPNSGGKRANVFLAPVPQMESSNEVPGSIPATNARAESSYGTAGTSTSLGMSSITLERRILVHEDAGVAITHPGNVEEVLELPPSYAAVYTPNTSLTSS